MNEAEVLVDDPKEEVLEVEAADGDEVESDEASTEVSKTEEADSEDVVVTIGEDSPPSEQEEAERAPEWVRELRKANREKDRQIRELQQRLQTPAKSEDVSVSVGVEPDISDDGIDYDKDKFKAAWSAWNQRKQAHEAKQREAEEAAKQAKDAWQAKLDAYNKAKAELRVKNFEEVEAVALEIFSVTQQGVILQGADNPAIVVAALGSNPGKAKELAAIADPVKFAFAVAKLETQMKVQQRKAAPVPDKAVRGTSGVSSAAADQTLARLRAEAEKTGDMSKVVAYKRASQSRAK